MLVLGPTGSTNLTGSHAWLPWKSHCAAPAKETGRGHPQTPGVPQNLTLAEAPPGSQGTLVLGLGRNCRDDDSDTRCHSQQPALWKGDTHLTEEEAKAKATRQPCSTARFQTWGVGPPSLGDLQIWGLWALPAAMPQLPSLTWPELRGVGEEAMAPDSLSAPFHLPRFQCSQGENREAEHSRVITCHSGDCGTPALHLILLRSPSGLRRQAESWDQEESGAGASSAPQH